jgi:hypothetical protein
MERGFEELIIEPRGGDYVLSRTDSHGATSEIVLSAVNVMFLARLAPQVAREISATKVPAGSDASALVPVPVRQFYTGCDLHRQIVVLRFQDESGCVFDFSCDLTQAHDVAEALIACADKVSKAPKPTRR